MAGIRTKQVVTRYRRLAGTPFRSAAVTLQEAMTEAMHHEIGGQKVRDNYLLRECVDLAQTSDTFVLAYPQITDEFFFCELARFEKGANIPLCWGSPDQPGALIIGQQKPGQGREALLGVLQFLVVRNHVLLIESGGLRTGRLEEYLTWLLRGRIGAIGSESQVMLETEFDISALGGEGLADVKEVALVPIALKATEGRGASPETIERRDARDYARPDVAREILGIMGNSEADIDRLLAEVPPGGDVELRLSLFFKKGRSKGATNPSVASARQIFRNMENDAIALKSSSGKIIGHMAALSRETRVRLDGSIINFQDAARALWESFEFWVSSGKIEP